MVIHNYRWRLGLAEGEPKDDEAGGAQHLARLMGRARALEVMLSAEDYDAELAERYGWINRALPAAELGDFVSSLAQRSAKFPAAGRAVVKERVNAITLPSAEDLRLPDAHAPRAPPSSSPAATRSASNTRRANSTH